MSDFEDKLNSILSSPKDMEKIMGLARELGGSMSSGGNEQPVSESGSAGNPLGSIGDLDPRLLSAATRIFSQYSSAKNDKTDLMRSIKPYLRAERRKDLDRAVEMAKLAKIAKLAFSEFSGGDKDI